MVHHLSLDEPLLVECYYLLTQSLQVSPPGVVNKTQGGLLVTERETVQRLLSFSLTLQGLAVGEVRLSRQLTGPNQTLTQKMTIEEGSIEPKVQGRHT